MPTLIAKQSPTCQLRKVQQSHGDPAGAAAAWLLSFPFLLQIPQSLHQLLLIAYLPCHVCLTRRRSPADQPNGKDIAAAAAAHVCACCTPRRSISCRLPCCSQYCCRCPSAPLLQTCAIITQTKRRQQEGTEAGKQRCAQRAAAVFVEVRKQQAGVARGNKDRMCKDNRALQWRGRRRGSRGTSNHFADCTHQLGMHVDTTRSESPKAGTSATVDLKLDMAAGTAGCTAP